MHHGAVERNVHQVSFRSSAFPPDPLEGEDDAPGGTALAFWIAEILEANGLHPGEPVPEDYGWMVDVPGPGRVVVTANQTEPPDHYAIVVEDVPRRLRKPDPDAPALVARVVAALGVGLGVHPQVADVSWDQGGPTT